ncbi:MAG: energy transducer TonB [Myxococcales bacterium]|nr:energy transducer TonB [Myxococcales bacterium]MCB9581060.1 energy transducer TonB [Polyangiaceae bacterium]
MRRFDVPAFIALTSALATACGGQQTPEAQAAPAVAVVDVPKDTPEEDTTDGGAPVQVIEEPADGDQPPPYEEGAPYDEYAPDPGDEAMIDRLRQNTALLEALAKAPPDGSGVAGGAFVSSKDRTNPLTPTSLPPKDVQKVVRTNLHKIKSCYESALKKTPALEGRIIVRFVIGLDGRVSSATRDKGGVSPEVDACVLRAFKGMRFPKPKAGVVVVRYPVVFKSS